MPRSTLATIENQADKVMRMAWDRANSNGPPIANNDVRGLLGVDRPAALRVLNWLVERGTLRRQGDRRGTTYIIADPSAMTMHLDD